MNRLLKFNINLIKFLRTELKKKKSVKELILLFKVILKRYFQVLLQELRILLLIFDIDYQIQKKKYKKYQQIKKEVLNAIKLLKYTKIKLQKAGFSRQRIRRFFMDLGSNEEAMQKLIEELIKEIK